jgi:hypothetical protein
LEPWQTHHARSWFNFQVSTFRSTFYWGARVQLCSEIMSLISHYARPQFVYACSDFYCTDGQLL